MFKTLLHLQLKLLFRTYKSSPQKLLFHGVAMIVVLATLVDFASTKVTENLMEQLVLLTAVGNVGFLIYVITLPDADLLVNPRTLSPVPLKTRELSVSLVGVNFINPKTLLVLVSTSVSILITLVKNGPTAEVKMVLVLGLLLNLVFLPALGSGLSSALASFESPTAKTIMQIVASFSIVGLMAGYFYFAKALNNLSEISSSASTVASYLAGPLGVIRLLETGQPGKGALMAIVVVAVCAISLFTVAMDIFKTARHPYSANRGGSVMSSGTSENFLLPGLPATPWAAEFTRAFRYSFRDSRQLLSWLIMMPVLVAIWFFAKYTGNEYYFILVPILGALLLGMNSCNPFGYDGGGLWQTLSSLILRKEWLLARYLGTSVPQVLIFLASVLGFVLLSTYDTYTKVVVVVVSIVIHILGFLIAAYMGVRNAFPTARPGTSPWNDPSGYSVASYIALMLIGVGSIICVIPGILLSQLGSIFDDSFLKVFGLVSIIAVPSIACWIFYGETFAYFKVHILKIYSKVSASI